LDVSQLYEVGNRKFFVAELNSDGTFGEKSYHEGLIEVIACFLTGDNGHSSRDIPDFNHLQARYGRRTVKFAVLPYSVTAVL
jgi:hypothetical protein